MDRRLALNRVCSELQGCSFLHATLPGRASQGRGSRSSRERKAASGAPAAYSKTQQRVAGTLLNVQESFGDPKTDISISICWKYPYLIGLHYKGVFWGANFSQSRRILQLFFRTLRTRSRASRIIPAPYLNPSLNLET